MFFLLYEGSGTAKRLQPFASDRDLEPLWRVKHLRLEARHDVDHGTDSESKHNKIGAAYIDLIGTPIITTPREWARAQLKLYTQLLGLLEHILRGMTENQPTG